ncbi:hypothetical protein V6N13_105113 [Hibiscus sabdariffa]
MSRVIGMLCEANKETKRPCFILKDIYTLKDDVEDFASKSSREKGLNAMVPISVKGYISDLVIERTHVTKASPDEPFDNPSHS